MAVNYTENQLKIINSRDQSLVVSASAGSGKTSVLVERILSIITDESLDVDIDQLLVVTFTNLAAAEMKERIYQRIVDELNKNPLNKKLKRQLNLMSKAPISTIHSFCKNVISDNYHALQGELSPNMNIDDVKAQLLKDEAVNYTLEKFYSENDDDFRELTEMFGHSKTDDRLIGLLYKIDRFISAMPQGEKWLQASIYNLDLFLNDSENPYAQHIIEILKDEISDIIKKYQFAIDAIFENSDLENYQETFQNERLAFSNCIENADLEDIRINLLNIEFDRLKGCKKGANNIVVKGIRDSIKTKYARLISKYCISNMKEISKMFPVILKLVEVLLEYKELYRDLKRQKDILDFNDLEHYALKILSLEDDQGVLTPSSTAFGYQNYFYEILIDEFQDTNDLQETIFSLISKENNVFMVGDVKQSIYKFRHARPEILLQKIELFENATEKQVIALSENFRSRGQVIDFANFVFDFLMTKTISKIDYKNKDSLKLGASYPTAPIDESAYNCDILVVKSKLDDALDEEDELSEQLSLNIEAQAVGNKILEIVDNPEFKIFDKELKDYRTAKFSDIVILLRSMSESSQKFISVLEQLSIPIWTDQSNSLLDTYELNTFLALLRVVDNPYLDIDIVSILRSAIFQFSDEELVEIRLMRKDDYFYNAVKLHGEKSEKSKEFVQKIEKWRLKAKMLTNSKMVKYLLLQTHFIDLVGAMPNGAIRRENLRYLMQTAASYENDGFKGVGDFIKYIDRMISSQKSIPSAKEMPKNGNFVRVMTIHKSKGLEFDIVFVSRLSGKFNTDDVTKERLLLHKEFGFGFDFIDNEKRCIYPSITKKVVADAILKDQLNEELRILYVALTRAKQKLILSVAVNNLDKLPFKWIESALQSDAIAPSDFYDANSYADWIMPAIFRHNKSEILTSAYDVDTTVITNCDLNIEIYDSTELSLIGKKRKEIKVMKTDFTENFDIPQIDFKFDEIFNYRYPFEDAVVKPSKISVTELRKLNVDKPDNFQFYVPAGSDEQFKNTAQAGINVHLFFEHFNLSLDFTDENICSEINRISEKLEISLLDEHKINGIKSFFSGSFGQRLKNADKIWRERKFFLNLKANTVFNELKNTEDDVLLEGIIDLCFLEQDKIILVDFKSTKMSEQNIKDSYNLQLQMYQKAIEEIEDKKVAEKYIYVVDKSIFITM